MNRIFGNIICQNAMPYILTTLNSMSCCDEIYICDGGSTDGTWEWLNSVKDIYNLELYQNPFKSILSQRQWLLKKTPKNSWIVALDQDESLTRDATYHMREVLESITLEQIKGAHGKIPVCVHMPFYNLIKDTQHYAKDTLITLASKVFYFDSKIDWAVDYHCVPRVRGTENDYTYALEVKPTVGILHWAFLDPARNRQRCQRLKNNKDAGANEYQTWCVRKHEVTELPYFIKP